MRTYERTHPWLSFSLDMRRASITIWMLLGEAQSKCEHIAGIPLRPDTAERLHSIYLAKGALATTAIEGNTLSEDEVLKRIEGKLPLPPSKEYMGQEIDNIVAACNGIADDLFNEKKPADLCVEKIKKFNELVLRKLPLEDGVLPGEIRKHPVGVGRYRAVEAVDCEFLLEKLCIWLSKGFEAPNDAFKMAFGILKSIAAHVYIAWIHPFGDGNGRTARLIEFQTLLSCGVPSAAAHLLSNHYNKTRSEYYRQLELTSQTGGDLLPFVEYALQGFIDELKEQLIIIRNQQWDVTWRNYVHEKFKDKSGEMHTRQRRLALDLSKQDKPVPISKLREITPRIALAYANKTQKTLVRDLNALKAMGLVEPTSGGYRAMKDIILAFLPGRIAEH